MLQDTCHVQRAVNVKRSGSFRREAYSVQRAAYQLPGQVGPARVAGYVEQVHLAHVEEGVELHPEPILQQAEGPHVVPVYQETPHLHLFRHPGTIVN